MKRLIPLLLLILGSTAWADSLTLYDKGGQPHSIDLDNNTAVIAFATWCPSSRGLAGLLKDPAVKPYIQDLHFYYGMTYEWPHIEKKLANMGKSDKLPELKARSGDEDLYRPEVLKGMPGEVLYFNQEQLGLIDGFPEVYSEKTGRFDADMEDWLLSHTKIPASLLKAKAKGYGFDQ